MPAYDPCVIPGGVNDPAMKTGESKSARESGLSGITDAKGACQGNRPRPERRGYISFVRTVYACNDSRIPKRIKDVAAIVTIR